MDARPASDDIEPELRRALPRRPYVCRAPEWLSLRLLASSVPLFVAWACLYPAWLLVLATWGTAVEAKVVQRHFDARGYGVTLAYPLKRWRGGDHTVQKWVGVETAEYGGLVSGRLLPARRLGRGALQAIRIETDGRPLDAATLAWTLAFVAPLAGGALAAMWGRLLLELWLVSWGRPVRGVVRRCEARQRLQGPFVSFEYRELAGRRASATLHGRVRVTPTQYEGVRPGQPLTILHSVWNPRWHVAYPFSTFAARERGGG